MANIIQILIEAKDEATAKLKSVGNATEDAGKQAEKGSGGFRSLTGSFIAGNLIAGGVTAGFGLLKNQVGDLFKQASDHQTAMTQLNAVIKSTGDASGYTSEQAQALAEKIQATTPISRDAAMSAENMLMTFTNIGKSNFGDATTAATDLATAMNGGLTPNADQLRHTALQLGRALNDPATGMKTLSREGVTFDAQQQKTIKTMVAAGDSAGAQALMLKELHKEFGGSATAAAGTYAGKMQMMKTTMDDAKASMGAAIEKGVQPLATAFASFVSGNTFKKWLADVTQFIQDLSQWLQTATKFYMAHKEVINAVAKVMITLGTAFGIVIGLLKAAKVAQEAFTAVTKLFAETNPWVLAITAIIAIGLLVITHWHAISTEAKKLWADVTGFFHGLWNDIKAAVQDGINFVKGHWALIAGILLGPIGYVAVEIVQHWNTIKQGFINAWNSIVGWFSSIPSRIMGAMGNLGNLLFGAGKDVINGLIHGVESMAGSAANAVKNAAKGMINGAKDILKIFSPSRVFHDIGRMTGQGLVNGVNSMQDDVAGAMSNLSGNGIQATVNASVNGMAGSGSFSGGNVSNVNNSQQATVTIQQVVLGDASAVHSFFDQLDRDGILTSKGLSPARGLM